MEESFPTNRPVFINELFVVFLWISIASNVFQSVEEIPLLRQFPNTNDRGLKMLKSQVHRMQIEIPWS